MEPRNRKREQGGRAESVGSREEGVLSAVIPGGSLSPARPQHV